MKIGFFFYSRAPLGRRLRLIVEVCQAARLMSPKALLLTSRQRRADISLEEILASAESSPSDSCEIRVASGEISLAWVYGGRRHIPRLWGTLTLSSTDIRELTPHLDALGLASGATYGLADLSSVRDLSMASVPDLYESNGDITALQSLHWYNYFGRELSNKMPRCAAVREAVSEWREFDSGGFRVLIGSHPERDLDASRVRRVASEWPFFRAYDHRAGFSTAVKIDYSSVWELASPDTKLRRIAELVGDADEFIANVPEYAATFTSWARKHRVSLNTEEDFRAALRKHASEVRDELLLPAFAAYGEAVRMNTGGRWRKSRVLHRGEPVLVRPGQPWSQRRIVLEVMEALDFEGP